MWTAAYLPQHPTLYPPWPPTWWQWPSNCFPRPSIDTETTFRATGKTDRSDLTCSCSSARVVLTNTDTKNYVPVSIAVQYRIALAYFTTSSTVASIDLAKVELSGSEFIDAIENQLLIFWQRMDWINNKAAEEEKYQMKKIIFSSWWYQKIQTLSHISTRSIKKQPIGVGHQNNKISPGPHFSKIKWQSLLKLTEQ